MAETFGSVPMNAAEIIETAYALCPYLMGLDSGEWDPARPVECPLPKCKRCVPLSGPHKGTTGCLYIAQLAARAAILATLDAIREPSEAMIENDEISEITLRCARTLHSSEIPVADIWRAMIDALKRELAG